MSPPVSQSRWMFPVAIVAMVLGMGLAWSQLAVQWGTQLPANTVAKVGQHWIDRDELSRAINGANTSRREPLSAAQEKVVLQRLINELLLLQYGQDLGLVSSNPSVRKPLVQAVLGIVRANAKAKEITEAEARDWYQQNSALFQHDGKYQVRYYRVLQKLRNAEFAQQSAEQLRAQLLASGTAQPAQLQQWQADQVSYVPSAMLPPNKLRDYLGQRFAEAIIELNGRGVTQALPINGGFALLQVLDYQSAGIPEFDAIKTQVFERMRQQSGEQDLAALFEDLRADYPVQIASDWQHADQKN